MNVTTIKCGLMQANCYIAENSDSAVIVDPGALNDELKNYIGKNPKKVKYILLTHRHFDHVNAADAVRSLTGAKIAVHALDECGLYDDDANLVEMCRHHYAPASPDIRADMLLKEGDVISFGNDSLTVTETPGHSPGGVCFVGENEVFCGDTLFKCSVGRTDIAGGNAADLAFSLEKLRKLPDTMLVYPGHGRPTDIGTEKKNNIFLQD